jgi:hypothetical protein
MFIPTGSGTTASSTRANVPVSDDPCLKILPVAVAQHALVELAGRQLRPLGLEVDRVRALLPREVRSAERDQLVCDGRPGAMPGMSWIAALTFSPRSSLGTPNTAASATFGCVIRKFSHSGG